MNPTVSVIMPCYNGARYVVRGASSVLGQRFTDLELLIIDDGSSDGSADLAATIDDSRIRVLRAEHSGVSAARNRGISEARGELIAFHDVDDTWHSDFLRTMVAALAERPECALAYCGWRNIGVPGGRGEPYIPPVIDGVACPEQVLASCPWPIHAALSRTEAVKATHGFEQSLTVGEDFLLWLEIACFQPIVQVPEVLAYYHHYGAGQASRQALHAALQPLAAQEIFLRRHRAIGERLGRRSVRELTLGRLLRRGYQSYWSGDLDTARAIFRRVIRAGYGGPRDWTYMLPSLLPSPLHRHALGWMRSLRS
jgi:glycosyltransferase involved in cell wall biosynthesis